MTIEDMSEGKHLINYGHSSFSVMLLTYIETQALQEAWTHEGSG